MMRLIFALSLIFWLSTISYCGESVKSKDYFVDGPVVVPLTSTIETSTDATLPTATTPQVVLSSNTTITLVESSPASLSAVGPTVTALTEEQVYEGTMSTLFQDGTVATTSPHEPKQLKPTEISLSNYILINTNSIDNSSSANSGQSLPQFKSGDQEEEKDITFGFLFGVPLLALFTLCCCVLLFCLCNRYRRSDKCKMHGREKFKNSPLIKKPIDDDEQFDAEMSDVQVVEFRHEQPLHLDGPVAEPFTDLHIPIQIEVTDETEVVENEKVKLLGKNVFDPENRQKE